MGGHGRAVLPPDLARDVPVPVIGVAERDLAFPVRDLLDVYKRQILIR